MYDTHFNCKLLWSDCTAVAPTNGAVTSTTVVHGQTTTYSCTTSGYSLFGNATQTCTSGSLSDAAPTCEQGTFFISSYIKYLHVTFYNAQFFQCSENLITPLDLFVCLFVC